LRARNFTGKIALVTAFQRAGEFLKKRSKFFRSLFHSIHGGAVLL